ncbi:hypothetical protein C0993_007955, partial [Termitomyces sp. T159_Od127]
RNRSKMCGARQRRNHARISRGYRPLEPRAPALITLPISMPSIPLLGPLITPLIAGTNKPAAKTSKLKPTHTPVYETTLTPAPTTPPVPTPTTAAGENTGDGPADTSSWNNFSTSRSVDGKTTRVVDGAGSTSVRTGGSTASSPHPSGASGNGPVGGNGSGNGASGSGASSSPSSNDINFNGSIANVAGNANPTGGTGGTGSNSPGGGLVNGGNAHSVTSGVAGSSVIGFPDSTSTALSGPHDASNTGDSSSKDTRSSLSGGAIAGIVIVITLGLIAVTVVLLRGRYRQRRSERRNHWWNRSGTRLSTESVSRASVRSSFETTINYAQIPRVSNSIDSVPALPPMAEVRGRDDIQLFSPNLAIPDSPMLIAFDNSQSPGVIPANNRTSIHSIATTSSGSHHGSHYLEVPNGDDRETSSPVSVRPFSPSESFSFPMPPKAQSGDSSSSRPMSVVTLHSGSRSLKCGTSSVPAVPSNPFSDPSNPFSDPVSPTTEFAEVEPIRRPFKSTRDDELTVTITDSVRILQLFDDGWALVEKLPAFEEILAKQGKNIHRLQGMIPIDCFHAGAEEISTSLSEKRASSTLY